MIHDRATLEARRSVLEDKRAELVREDLYLAWANEFVGTLERGGGAVSTAPYDFQGAWRLVTDESGRSDHLTVLVREELPQGVEPRRPLVEMAALAVAECERCHELAPLIGRCVAAEVGFGDVGSSREVAVVHCESVQLVPDKTFEPHQSFYDGQRPPQEQ